VLHDDDSTAHLLGKLASQTQRRGVCDIEVVGGLLAGVDEDDGRAWSLPVLGIPPVSLLEGAERRVGVVEQLVEIAPTSGGIGGRGDLELLVNRTNLHTAEAGSLEAGRYTSSQQELADR